MPLQGANPTPSFGGFGFSRRLDDVHTRFYGGGHPTAPALLKQAASECDVVVGGFAD